MLAREFGRRGVGVGRGVLAVVLLGMAGCAPRGPVYTLEVKGHVQSLSTSGTVLVGDFLGNKTYLWNWGNLRQPAQVFDRGQALAVGLLGREYVFAEVPGGREVGQPHIIMQQRQTRRVVRQWPFHANWYCGEFVSSFNGRHMGVLLEESNPTGGDTCLGLVGAGASEIAWVPTRGRLVRPEQAGDSMAVSNDGRYIAVLGLGDIRALVVADMAGRRIAWRRAMPRSRSVAFSADSRILYVGGHHGIRAMMADTGRPVGAWSPEGSGGIASSVARIATSPDGRFVAAGTDWPAGEVHLFESYTGRETARWSVSRKKTLVEGLAFAPGGTYLATADQESQSIQMWSIPRAGGRK